MMQKKYFGRGLSPHRDDRKSVTSENTALAGPAGVWTVCALTSAGLVVGQGTAFLRMSGEISTTRS